MPDDDVRDLMQQASSTIRVDPLPADHPLLVLPPAPSHRPRRPWLAPGGAVAAVLLVVVGVLLVRGGDGGGDDLDRRGAASDPGATTTDTSSPALPPREQSRLAAEAFVAFAEGGPSDVPWADEVTYYVGGREAAVLRADQAAQPTAWDDCAEGAAGAQGAEYAGRACPVSALAPVADLVSSGGAPSYDPRLPTVVGCSTPAPPAGLQPAATTSIRPPTRQRDCFSDFAVTLYSDDDGRVVAVNLELSSP